MRDIARRAASLARPNARPGFRQAPIVDEPDVEPADGGRLENMSACSRQAVSRSAAGSWSRRARRSAACVSAYSRARSMNVSISASDFGGLVGAAVCREVAAIHSQWFGCFEKGPPRYGASLRLPYRGYSEPWVVP